MFLNNVNKYVSVLQTNHTLLSMFCRRGSSPFGKVVPHEPPYPSEITAFEPSPPLPVGISSDPPCGGRAGYGYFLEPHNGCAFHSLEKIVSFARVLGCSSTAAKMRTASSLGGLIAKFVL